MSCTRNLPITEGLLCQLSYVGLKGQVLKAPTPLMPTVIKSGLNVFLSLGLTF